MRSVDGVAAADGAVPPAVRSPWPTTPASASGPINGAPTLAFSAVAAALRSLRVRGPRAANRRRDRALRDGGRGRRREGRRPHPRPGHAADPAVHARRHHDVRRRGIDGRRGVRRADAAGGPGARRRAREDHRSRRAGAAGRHADRAQAARQRAGRSRSVLVRTGAEDARQESTGPVADPRLPQDGAARLRPHRAARRRRSSSSTRSRSPSRSARGSSGCCARSARRASRSCRPWCSRRC